MRPQVNTRFQLVFSAKTLCFRIVDVTYFEMKVGMVGDVRRHDDQQFEQRHGTTDGGDGLRKVLHVMKRLAAKEKEQLARS